LLGARGKVRAATDIAVVYSTAGSTHLLEAAVLTDQPTVTSQVRALIEALQNRFCQLMTGFFGVFGRFQ